MRYEDLQLLLEWSRLQLRIAIARSPGVVHDLDEKHVYKSLGYKKLRLWFRHQSPKGRDRARKWMQSQLDGVREILAKAKAGGEDISLAELEINYRDAETKEPIGQVPAMAPDDEPTP